MAKTLALIALVSTLLLSGCATPRGSVESYFRKRPSFIFRGTPREYCEPNCTYNHEHKHRSSSEFNYDNQPDY